MISGAAGEVMGLAAAAEDEAAAVAPGVVLEEVVTEAGAVIPSRWRASATLCATS